MRWTASQATWRRAAAAIGDGAGAGGRQRAGELVRIVVREGPPRAGRRLRSRQRHGAARVREQRAQLHRRHAGPRIRRAHPQLHRRPRARRDQRGRRERDLGRHRGAVAIRLRARTVGLRRDHRLAQEHGPHRGVLLHRPGRLLRRAHRPAAERRRGRRGGVPGKGAARRRGTTTSSAQSANAAAEAPAYPESQARSFAAGRAQGSRRRRRRAIASRGTARARRSSAPATRAARIRRKARAGRWASSAPATAAARTRA